MNPRPILIATCIAIALVAFVYFSGKQHFLEPSVDEPQPATPIAVSTPKPTTETTDGEETTDGGNTEGESKTETPIDAELERIIEANNRIIKAKNHEIEANEHTIHTLALEINTLKAKLQQEEEAKQKEDIQLIADTVDFRKWVNEVYEPEFRALRKELTFFFDNNVEVSPQAFANQYANREDQVNAANKLQRFIFLCEEYATRLAEVPQPSRQKLIDFITQKHGVEWSKEIVELVNEKSGEL